MAKLYINPMSGQQCIAEAAPAGCWCCVGETSTIVEHTPVNNFQDIDMTAPDDFEDELNS